MAMEAILGKEDSSGWVYRGEGAANLVIAYTGTSPAFVGKVLRIPKVQRNRLTDVKGGSVLTSHERILWKENKDLVAASTREVALHQYVKLVMIPLLGADHVDPGVLVHVSKEFLELMEEMVVWKRPSWRIHASKIDSLCDHALMMSDHSMFTHGVLKDQPCISVEIKPKCGFLPCSRFIVEGNAIKKRITRFTMHQALKLHEGEIAQVSEYNPLDLFSGSKHMIHKAIGDLFATPQNNFRVFLNGFLVFGGLEGCGRDNANFVKGLALDDILKGFIGADDGLRTARFIQLIVETIYKSRILDQLLVVQKLDVFDIEGAIHAYYNIKSLPCLVCKYLVGGSASHQYSSLHSISLDESLKIVRGYLISATVKDCSLMISFRPKENGDDHSSYNDVCLDSTGQSFDYKAYFIDLDIKPLEKMEYYYKLDQKIVSHYTEIEKRQIAAKEKAANVET